MSVSGQRICALAEEAAAAAEPEVALETLTRIRDELQEFERQQVARALTSGRSYGDVARAMGISRQAAHRRFKDLLKRNRRRSERLPPTPEVRLVFEYAREEARALGASELAPVHVVLGILRNGDQRAAAALTASGARRSRTRGGRRVARSGAVGDGGGRQGRHPERCSRRRRNAPAAAGRSRSRSSTCCAARWPTTITEPAACSSGSASRRTACWRSSTPRRRATPDCLEA